VLVLARVAGAAPPLNVVFILTVNQAPWTLGCYGNGDISEAARVRRSGK